MADPTPLPVGGDVPPPIWLPLTPEERATIMRNNGIPKHEIPIHEAFYQAADIHTKALIDTGMRLAANGEFMAGQAGRPTVANADGETLPGEKPGGGGPRPVDPLPDAAPGARPPGAPEAGEAPVAPGRFGQVAQELNNAGKGAMIVLVVDGILRDAFEAATGQQHFGFIGPLLKDTWVDQAFTWLQTESPIISKVIHDADGISHTLGVVAAIGGFAPQLFEVIGHRLVAPAIQAVIDGLNAVIDAFAAVGTWIAEQIELGIQDVASLIDDLGTVLIALAPAIEEGAATLAIAGITAVLQLDQAGEALVDGAGQAGGAVLLGAPAVLGHAGNLLDSGSLLFGHTVQAAIETTPTHAVVSVLGGGGVGPAPGTLLAIHNEAHAVVGHAHALAQATATTLDNATTAAANAAHQALGHAEAAANAVGNGFNNAVNAAEARWNSLFGE
jgi:hypothetical protein